MTVKETAEPVNKEMNHLQLLIQRMAGLESRYDPGICMLRSRSAARVIIRP